MPPHQVAVSTVDSEGLRPAAQVLDSVKGRRVVLRASARRGPETRGLARASLLSLATSRSTCKSRASGTRSWFPVLCAAGR
eukprot:904184-Rhodomonas_salina.2